MSSLYLNISHEKPSIVAEPRLRVVPHFSSGIVERAKRKHAWKSPHARKGDTRRGEIYFLSFNFFLFFSLHCSLCSMACLHHATNQMNLTVLNDFIQSKTLNLFEWDLRYADGVYHKSRRPTSLNLMNLVSLSNTIIVKLNQEHPHRFYKRIHYFKTESVGVALLGSNLNLHSWKHNEQWNFG